MVPVHTVNLGFVSKAVIFRESPFPASDELRTVLVTGAAGRIGSCFAELSHDRYKLRLMVRGDEAEIDAIRPFGDVVECDLADQQGLKDACAGIDTVIHLAADHRVHAPWEELLPNNIVGTYNLFAAAKEQGCRRVVYASSVNAMNSAPRGIQIRPDDPVSPGNLYGVSKTFGESLCRLYATREELSSFALRIGAFQTLHSIRHHHHRIPFSIFVSPRDLNQLLNLCVDDLLVQFGIFHALSANQYNHFDISETCEVLGYRPVDDAYAPEPDQASN